MRIGTKRINEQAEHMEHKENRARQDTAEDRADDAEAAERIVHHAADEVEHHAHRAGNEAERKDTHIGQDVRKVAGDVIQRAKAGADAHEGVLLGTAGEQQQHAAAERRKHDGHRFKRRRRE